jgi:menaquinone-dependent protoporphyrinogen IX oxidase
VPAMSRLEARIAFEPVYMQHYASTLYALVSRIPTTLAERRQAFDLLA